MWSGAGSSFWVPTTESSWSFSWPSVPGEAVKTRSTWAWFWVNRIWQSSSMSPSSGWMMVLWSAKRTATSCRAGKPGLVAEQGGREPVLRQRLGQIGDHLRGGVVEAVEDPHEHRADVVRAIDPGRCRVTGEAEQVIPLVHGQTKPAGDRGHHLLGRLWTAPLLQASVVVGGHGRQAGDLVAFEARDAPPRPLCQPHVPRLQGFAPSTQEVC